MSEDLKDAPMEEPVSHDPRPSDSDPYLSSDVPNVPSPYEGSTITVSQHLKISAYWFATNFLWGALLTIMLPGEAKHLAPHFRVMALAVLTAISAIVALAVPLIAGALSDRCAHRLGRRRPFIIAGVIINLVGLFLMDLAFKNAPPLTSASNAGASTFRSVEILLSNPGFLAFLFAYMVVQFGNNVASAAYSGVIPDLVPHEQRGAASGYMALMSQFGTLLGVVGCGLLLHGQTETVKFMLLSTVLAAITFVTVLGIRETPLPHKPPPIRWGPYVRSLWIDPKKYPDFAWVWITRFLVMLGFYSVLPYVNYYLSDVIGTKNPDDAASKLVGIILVASSLSGIYAGYLSDRVGRKRVVYIANTVIAVMALAFIACGNLEQVIVVGVMFGLGFGAYTSVDWALGTDVLPSRADAGKEMAVWHISMTLPQTVAAPIAGLLISAFGRHVIQNGDEPIVHYTLAGYSAVFILCAVCFALGAYFLKNVKGVK